MAYINGNEVLFSPQVTVVGGGVDIDVDTMMSDTSENPVQNKVVKAYVDEKTAPATRSTYGTIKATTLVGDAGAYGFYLNEDGFLQIVPAVESDIDNRDWRNSNCPITPSYLDYAVKSVGNGYYALADDIGDIDTALDSIIAMQESLIGGGAE